MSTALKLAQDYASLKERVRLLCETVMFYGDGVMGEEQYPLSHYEQELETAKSMLTEMEAKLSSVKIHVW